MEKEIKDKGGEHPLGDLGQSLFFILFLAVWIGDSFFLHLSAFVSAFLPFYIRFSVTMALFILSAFLYKSGHNVTPHHGERPTVLKTDGAFRYVRHPLYLATILMYLGIAIYTFSILSLLVVAAMAPFFNYIASFEESFLERKFGDKYGAYKRRTGKWLPHLG